MLLLVLLALQSPAYLHTASLTPMQDTIDTYEGAPNGPIVVGSRHYVVRVVRQIGPRRWEYVDTWYDSTGQQTAQQYARTADGTTAIDLVVVRSPTDSASMLVTRDRVTAWVVPAGSPPRLYDSAAIGERYDALVVASAIARTHPTVGSVFRYPAYTLYGGSPVPTRPDSLRVVRRDTLHRGQVVLPVVVLERGNGGQNWVDETTPSQGPSPRDPGPRRWGWPIRREVTPPQLK